MADAGWVFDEGCQEWQLRGQDDRMLGTLTARFVARVGTRGASDVALRRGWPPLTGRGSLVCVLLRGPLDGRIEYLPGLADPPDEMLLASAACGGEGLDLVVRPQDRYRLDAAVALGRWQYRHVP